MPRENNSVCRERIVRTYESSGLFLWFWSLSGRPVTRSGTSVFWHFSVVVSVPSRLRSFDDHVALVRATRHGVVARHLSTLSRTSTVPTSAFTWKQSSGHNPEGFRQSPIRRTWFNAVAWTKPPELGLRHV
jgi:hypothetical protein